MRVVSSGVVERDVQYTSSMLLVEAERKAQCALSVLYLRGRTERAVRAVGLVVDERDAQCASSVLSCRTRRAVHVVGVVGGGRTESAVRLVGLVERGRAERAVRAVGLVVELRDRTERAVRAVGLVVDAWLLMKPAYVAVYERDWGV